MNGRPPEELRLSADSRTLAARAWGPNDGHRVLALHGWLDNAASFDPVAARLDGTRVVALEFAGHGHSDHRPPGQRYHFIDYVDDVLAAAQALGWVRFSLLGHSLGGAVAAFAAAARPQCIDRLALIEALGPLSAPPAGTPEQLARAFAPPPERRGPRQAPATLEQAIEARRAVATLGATAARALVERATEANEAGLRWRSDPRLRRPSPARYTEAQVTAVLAAIRAPAVLVAGKDGFLPADDTSVAQRIEAVPDLTVHRLPGHHHLHMDDPAPVAEVLQPFLVGRTDQHPTRTL